MGFFKTLRKVGNSFRPKTSREIVRDVAKVERKGTWYNKKYGRKPKAK